MSAAVQHVRGPLTWAVLGALAGALYALCVGSTDVGPAEVIRVLFGDSVDAGVRDIVLTVRLPRVLLGLVVGASLSISGAVFQALLRNDLAEPYLIGVGPGALFGVTIAALLFGAAGSGTMPPAAARSAGALLGALGVAALVFSFARKRARAPTISVLLAGIAVGAFVHAVATMILYATIEDWHHVVRWMLGDLSFASYGDVIWVASALVVGTGIVLWWARDLDVLTLGDESAWHAGVSVRRALWWAGGAACLLAAVTVAQCGLIGFVGLVVPHIARRWVGPSHRRLVLITGFLGAGLLVIADAISRNLLFQAGVPLGVVTAVLGAPVLAYLIVRRGDQ